MKTTASTTTQDFEYPSAAPILELLRILPGPITTQAVIKPGPTRRYQGRSTTGATVEEDDSLLLDISTPVW